MLVGFYHKLYIFRNVCPCHVFVVASSLSLVWHLHLLHSIFVSFLSLMKFHKQLSGWNFIPERMSKFSTLWADLITCLVADVPLLTFLCWYFRFKCPYFSSNDLKLLLSVSVGRLFSEFTSLRCSIECVNFQVKVILFCDAFYKKVLNFPQSNLLYWDFLKPCFIELPW